MVALPRQLAPPDPDSGDLRAEILRTVIRSHGNLLALRDRAEVALEADPTLERWFAWLGVLCDESERLLVGSILNTNPAIPSGEVYEAMFAHHAPRGIASDGKFYLAVPDPNLDPLDGDRDGEQVMRLVVLSWADVTALVTDGSARLVINPLDESEGGQS